LSNVREGLVPGRLKSVALTALVAAAALVPLYGDPRSTPVSHAEWARMLLRGLELDGMAPAAQQASQVFSILSWRNSLALRADQYSRADGIAVDENVVRAEAQAGEVQYPLAVVRGGDYRLRVRLSGDPQAPAEAQIVPAGATVPVGRFTVVPASMPGWVDAGVVHLDPGAYTADLALPPGTALQQVEVVPPCLAPVEPIGGWRATAITHVDDVAVTLVKALDLESELAPAASPIEVAGRDFEVAAGSQVTAAGAMEGFALRSGPTGLQAVVMVEVPEEGLYTLDVFGLVAGGQSWLGNACRKAVLCEQATTPGMRPEWRSVMTAELAAGRHFFNVILGPDASIERLRLTRKKRTAEDYRDAVRRLGFDPGPAGPVTRRKAVEAMQWLRAKRLELAALSRPCGDPLTTLVAQAALTGQPLPPPPAPPPGASPGSPGSAPGASAPAPVPPQEPASATTLSGS
jgi:hypothetical protein